MENKQVDLAAGQLPSIVAHSFGTYILGYALLKYPFIRFSKVLLCGSLLPRDFPWRGLIDRGQVQAVRNEYGVQDIWARVVRWFVAGSGPSGVLGFIDGETDDSKRENERFEQAEFLYPHSEYFSEGHMEAFWLPFLERSLPEIPTSARPVARPKRSVPWMFWTLLLLLVVGLLRAAEPFRAVVQWIFTSVSSPCKEAFSDEFDGGMNPNWSLEDPHNDAQYNATERPSFLRLSVPPCDPSKPCNDLFPGNNFDAPRFVQRINGDFTVMTRLDFDPHYQYQGAGILVWQDENNFLRLERSKGDVANNTSGVHLDKREKGGPYTAIPSTELQPTPATQVELRMKRAGDHFTAWWREPGGIWRLVGETDIHLSDTKVGLALIAQHDVPEPTIAYYDYFHVLCD
jgi:regulation of enolase protein 1 (concanavalin A-like superfamily)